MEAATHVWARTVRGLEWVVAAEVRGRLGGEVVETRHRDVVFDIEAPAGRATDLRVADDVYELAGAVEGLGRHRSSLAELGRFAAAVDVSDLVERHQETSAHDAAGVAVTASFLGRRNYNRFDIEDAIGEPLAARLGVAYRSRRSDRPPPLHCLQWRVHIADDTALVGLRIGPVPLHRRPYKIAAPPGSLHPPVAAAMALLGGLHAGAVLLDPACGAGTIPIEASRWGTGATCVGADIATEAIAAAATNARAAGREVSWHRADASSIPLRAGTITSLVVNMPWGRQAAMTGALGGGDLGGFYTEVARLLPPDGRAVVLTEVPAAPALGDALELEVVLDNEISLSGSHPHIVVVARTGHGALTAPSLLAAELAAGPHEGDSR